MNVRLAKAIFVILIVILISGCKAPGGQLPDPETNDRGIIFSVQQLQEDFQFLRKKLEDYHPALYMYYSKETFNRFFDDAYALIDREMTTLEFFRLLAPVVAKVNCGHTYIDLSRDYDEHQRSNARLFPLGVAFIDGRAFVYQDLGSDSAVVPGTEILSINNTPVPEVLEPLLNGIPSDGLIETSKYRRINRHFFYYYYILIAEPERFELRCIAPGENSGFTLNVEARPYLDVWSSYSFQNPPDSRGNLVLEIRENSSTAILTVKSFATHVTPDFKTFMRTSFQEIVGRGIENLVIDVRGNGGGDPYHGADLIAYLIDTPFKYFSRGIGGAYPSLFDLTAPHHINFNGNVYFLIDGGCFSTTGHFCSLAKFHNLGVFIGEETGGSYYCNDNHDNRLLPKSTIKFQYAQTTWATAVTGFEQGRGIMPDHMVSYSLDDYINGTDPQMAFVLQLIAQNSQR
jgi:hypothetical protein